MSEWPHAPARRAVGAGTFFVTAGTYRKELFFKGDQRLELLHSLLLDTCDEFGWRLQSWAVFANHYHFVADFSEENGRLPALIAKIHACSSRELNWLDGTAGRKVWHNYRDTRLTNERSYLARLSYVYRNPVKHRMAPTPEMYRWCSASWFRNTADPAFFKTVASFPTDLLNIDDDF